jgi:hypothetical protein
MIRTHLLWWCSLATTLVAQAPTPIVVLARGSSGGQAALVQRADLATGALVVIGRFPSDTLAPLAVTVDPLDHAIVVALDLGNGASRIVRLLIDGGAVVDERVLADHAGPITSLCIIGTQLAFTAAGPGGGEFRLSRLGGPAVPSFVLPDMVLVNTPMPSGSHVTMAQRGETASNPGPAAVGSALSGGGYSRMPVSGFPGDVVGVAYPSSYPWNSTYAFLVGFRDGTCAEVDVYGSPATALALSPPVPAGGLVRLRSDRYLRPVALGGVSLPFVYAIHAGGNRVTLAGPFQGDPVDFWIEAGLMGSNATGPYGSSCGTTMNASGVLLPPQPPQFGLADSWLLGAVPGFPVLWVASFQGPQISGAAGRVAFPLPGGCTLLVPSDVVQFRTVESNGAAMVRVAIPPGMPGIAGGILLSQWLGLSPTGFSASNGVAQRLDW